MIRHCRKHTQLARTCRALSRSKYATETYQIPYRSDLVNSLKTTKEFDLLIIGAGATGSGAALDAARRGLKVACIEREDFASGTSSRSTKLLWGGSRYLVQAFVSLLNTDGRLFKRPSATIKAFVDDFKMVLNCHRERKFMLEEQPHLTSWLPIAVPLSKWLIWPPPFGFPVAAIGPIGLFPIFFKFYDSLSKFSCPPSHIMTPSRAQRKFPQLAHNLIKYCSVFYEGTHDDARTNLAIAQTAAREGATIVNYCQAISLIRRGDLSGTTKAQSGNAKHIVGAVVRDVVRGEEFPVLAKAVLFCGGPFTDELRTMEDKDSAAAVAGASGIHIVLPGYFAPDGIGLVDMNTSDGRFLFFLPWNGHVLVGTTDRPSKPTMRPEPDESEILWLLNEASKYISPELTLRRQDVLSAWAGIRPLAVDPHRKDGVVSRDHVISHNPDTATTFVSGGKWTTYREMAEDAVNKVIETMPSLRRFSSVPCETLTTKLIGHQGYSVNLERILIQEYSVSRAVANRLARAYGGRAHDVLKIAMETDQSLPQHQKNSRFNLLVPGYPYIEAEVIFSVRHDWAVHAEDILARRTRLAFLNKESALHAIPRIVELMSEELGWSPESQVKESLRCVEYMHHFGGSFAAHVSTANAADVVRMATVSEVAAVFRKVDWTKSGFIGRLDLEIAASLLNKPLSDEEIEDCISFGVKFDKKAEGGSYDGTNPPEDTSQDGSGGKRITLEAFTEWWNSERFNPKLVAMKANKMTMTNMSKVVGSGTLFG